MATQIRMTGEARREQLLDVALELFGSRGYDATSTRDIAVAAGVTDGLIYKYFQSKDELLAAAIDRAAEQLHSELLELPWQATARETVSLLIIDAASRMRVRTALIDLLWCVGQRSPAGMEHVYRLRRHGYQRIAHVLGELAGRGELCGELDGFHHLLHSCAFCFTLMRRWLDEESFRAELRDYAWSTAGTLLEGAGQRS